MSITPLRPGTIQSNTIHHETRRTIQSVSALAVNFFRDKANQILPRLTRLVGSQKIAQSIIDGLFSGFVISVALRILRISDEYLILSCIAGYLWERNFTLFPNSPQPS
jgi:superfamily I DNA/RNA helicase